MIDTITSFFAYSFAQNAILAVCIMAPLFAMIGTMVVNNKMAFFSEALGHSALTGVALGALIGISNFSLSMIVFAVVFAVVLNYIKGKSKATTDTIIAVFSSTSMALGLAILSSNGSINKYSSYIVGDILSITSSELLLLAVVLAITFVVWCFVFNKVLAISTNKLIAKTKGISVNLVENIFVILTAIVVMLSIRWVGILVINAMIIIPAAASRNLSNNMRQYLLFALVFALVSGIIGVILSFAINVATAPTIVCVSALIYFISLVFRKQ